MRSSRPHIGFVLEQALGHVTHAANLQRLIPERPEISAEVFEIPWDATGLPGGLPVFNSNWTVRSGVRARQGIRRLERSRPLDALFIHTQVPAMLVPDVMRRIPTVVSLDATPRQYDMLGQHYQHRTGSAPIEQLKRRVHRGCFVRAAHLVCWSAWAKQGLVDDYGLDTAKVTVIPPGVVRSIWAPRQLRKADSGRVRILFVGGDLERKGGDLLLDAFDQLRGEMATAGAPEVELHMVTNASVPSRPGVIQHRGLRPNTDELVALYQQADIFCLPSRGDCLPLALAEAGAAGLPLISTSVAAIPEIVRDQETGLLVPVDDRAALAGALRRLVESPTERRRLGERARGLVEREHDAETNAGRLAQLLASTAIATRPELNELGTHPAASLRRQR
jgi:glycosyltransferase involved in cell wall biosynthesis